MLVLVTGHAGFIGHHVARQLLARGDSVVGVDVAGVHAAPTRWQQARLEALAQASAAVPGDRYHDVRADLADPAASVALFERHRFDRVIHLAARPGIAGAAVEPHAYARSNLDAFLHLLEACRRHATPHLTYASSSSVYGANTRLPLVETDAADHPLQFYAATKRANELMAHAYAHLHGLPCTGLRFFTVYGPWGRPDMAPWIFTERILAGEPLVLYGEGRPRRDFTFVDDIVDGVLRSSDQVAQADPAWRGDAPSAATSAAPWRLFNIGGGVAVSMLDFVDALEQALGRRAVRELRPARPADAVATLADSAALRRATGWAPRTSLQQGLARWVGWYLEQQHAGAAATRRQSAY